MSSMEYNKGKLIPFDLTEEVAFQLVESKGETLRGSYESFLEQVSDDPTWYDEDLVRVRGKWYRSQFEVRGGDLDQLARAKQNEDGTIDFETYHWNGGAYWVEVVESAL